MIRPWSWLAVAIVIVSLSVAPVARATEYVIKVDGITGEISLPEIINAGTTSNATTKFKALVFEPGDLVKVQIVRANLITYGYRITLDKEEVLTVHHVIIGGPTVTDADQGGGTRDLLPLDRSASTGVDAALIEEYERIAKNLRAVDRRLAELQSTVADTESEVSGTMCAAGSGWPYRLLETRSQVYCALTGQGRKTSGGCVARASALDIAASCSESPLRVKLGDIEDALAALSGRLAVTKHEENDGGFASLQTAVTGLATSIEKSRAVAKTLQQTVDRWWEVMLSHPEATLSSTFLVDDISKRYTVAAYRFDANNPPPEKKVETAGDDKKNDAKDAAKDTAKNDAMERIANVVFEGHAFSHLNFALGLAHAYRSGNDTFEIVKSIAADKTTMAHVERKSHDTIQTKPIASLGVYLFRRVDGMDMKRGPVPMLSVGVEVAQSPDYFAGLGLDWPSGLTVSVGATRYQKTRLAPGWSIGQAVPLNADGTPAIAAPVTTTSTTLAPYIAIQFRPTIFRAFSALFRSGS